MKKSLLFVFALAAGVQGAALASNDAASVQRGAAKAFFCTDCHGYNGMGTLTAPAIAGEDKETMVKQLLAAKKKRSSIKGTILAKFDNSDIEDLAAYFSSLKKTPRGVASYERDIKPIIGSRCVSCHMSEGEGSNKSGLEMDTYESLMKGTRQGGALIVPGSPETSTFMVMLTRQDHLRMPYGQSPLSDGEIRVISKWIEQGAKNN